MKAGKLKQRISIYRPTTVQDDFYGNTVTRTLLGTYWAQIRAVSGSRGTQFSEVSFTTLYNIYLRGHIGVKPDDEVEYEGRVFVVQEIVEDFLREKTTTLTAVEKA